jgi:sulfur carrier protein ThiS
MGQGGKGAGGRGTDLHSALALLGRAGGDVPAAVADGRAKPLAVNFLHALFVGEHGGDDTAFVEEAGQLLALRPRDEVGVAVTAGVAQNEEGRMLLPERVAVLLADLGAEAGHVVVVVETELVLRQLAGRLAEDRGVNHGVRALEQMCVDEQIFECDEAKLLPLADHVRGLSELSSCGGQQARVQVNDAHGGVGRAVVVSVNNVFVVFRQRTAKWRVTSFRATP